MLTLPYEAGTARIVYVLAALVLAGLAGGLLLGKPNEERTGRLPRALRIGLSGILVISALIHLVLGAWDHAAELYAALIFLGMLCGFVGDLIMARLVRVPNRLVCGMAAFGAGHLLYSGAFCFLSLQLTSDGCRYLLLWLVPLGVFVLWAWNHYIRKPGGSKVINLGSLGYALVIAVMTSLALNLSVLATRLAAAGLGAALFVISDLVLGNWQVQGHDWPGVNDVIWTTYVLGQLLIVSSVAGAVICLS
ncbi:MAG TPA: lysoplasmalogenase [Anaerolineae bacterium]|mgnify:FL=1|nr:lysoplasmalogenase [Anaerolineae bacterium]HNT04937.1 lysoplasmalogenase [Anaerolineae bacterium]